MKARLMQTNFTGGEWSERLEGRVDLAKYANACYKLENMLLWPHGPADMRPGFRYIRNTKDSSKASRLIPFEFSTTQAYQLEFGDQYFRFYKDQAIITLTAQNVIGITKANPAVVTYDGSDTYSNSDKIIIASVVGMVEVNNREFTVANVNAAAKTFELSGIDSSAYTEYSSGGTVAEIYSIAHPYVEADLFEVKYCQSADILYLWHPDYAPRKLTRTGHTSWTLTTINFNPAPTDELPFKPATTLTPAATTGTGINFTAGAAAFLAGDINRIIKSGAGRASITAFTSTTIVVCTIIDDFASTDAIASGSWEIQGSPVGTGNLTPSAVGPKGAVITLTSTVNSFRSTDVGKYVRINSGFVRITAYTSALIVSGEVLKVLSAVTASTTWTLESAMWNSTDGYPSCAAIHEERLCPAGSTGYPETVWGSIVGDYENFTPGTGDSDAFQFTLGGRKVSAIKWIEPKDALLLGTPSGPFRLGPEDTGNPITPTNVLAKRRGSEGCASIMPVTVGESILYVQKAGFDLSFGRKIREFTFQWETDGYKAPDLTRLSEHISKGNIIDIAYQQEPLSILWCVRDDGVLIGLTYLREEEVVGWHRHPTDNGEVESISVIPGDGYDELWAIIKRTINDSTVRYVEMMEALYDDTAAEFTANKGLNAFFVDSGLTYNSTSTLTISGLWHLEGESVTILADGAVQPDKTVTNGKITLSRAASCVHVGLSYEGMVQTMRADVTLRDGTAQGRNKRVPNLVARVYKTGPFKAGRDAGNLDPVKFRDQDTPMGTAATPYTGDVRLSYEDRDDADARIMFVQDKPLPFTLVAIMPEVAINA